MHSFTGCGRIARWCARHCVWVIVAWLAGAAALNAAIPQLEQTVAAHSAPFTPEGSATRALRQMSHDFGVPASTAAGSVVMSRDDAPLTDDDRRFYRTVVQRLGADREHVAYLLDTAGTPGLEAAGSSPDGRALQLTIANVGDVGSTQAHKSVVGVRDIVMGLPRPPGLTVHVTGPAPTLSDVFSAIDTSLFIITGVSMVLIITILLIVYRSLSNALIPLLTVGLSLAVARPVISLLGGTGLLTVSNFTIALMTAMLLGAGTDYGIFLLSSYHEGRRSRLSVLDAVSRAGTRTAGIVIASALTIAGAGMAMAFTKIGLFRASGPPIAIGVALTVAVSLTLTPALLGLWGRRGWAQPRPVDPRRWQRRGARIIRRAPLVVVLALVLLVAAGSVLFTARPNIDENAMQTRETDSRTGYDDVRRHWGYNEAAPEFLIVRADHDMRNTNDLAALELMASAVAKLPTVAYVRSLTRPDGRPLAQTAVGYQTGIVGDRLGTAQRRLAEAIPALRQLAAGARQLRDGAVDAADRVPQLADGVNKLVDTTRTLLPILESADRLVGRATGGTLDVASVTATLSTSVAALRAMQDSLLAARREQSIGTSALHTVFDPVTAPVPPPGCDRSCVDARAAFAALNRATAGGAAAALRTAQAASPYVPAAPIRALLAQLPDLETVVDGLNTLVRQVGGQSPDDVRAQLDTLSGGVSQLSGGLVRLSRGLDAVTQGTDTTVDLTKQLNAGLLQATDYLHGMTAGTTDGAGRGFYLPRQAQQDPRFTAGTRLLMSPDGRSARMLVIWAVNPYGPEAIRGAATLATTARTTAKDTVLQSAEITSTGLSSISADHLQQTWRDFAVFGLTAVVAVLAILMLMLRSLVAPLLMVGAVVLSFCAAAGLSTLLWQHIIGIDLDWSVLPVSFMALVAVGADYSLLFASRIREESDTGTLSGIIKGFASTGGVITTAGLVFAITMFALMSGTVLNLVQTGSTVGLGLLLDITVVRTYLIPAAMALLRDAMWWPGGRHGSRQT